MTFGHILPQLPNVRDAKASKPKKPLPSHGKTGKQNQTLSDTQVGEIRWLCDQGFTYATIAKIYGMSKIYVCKLSAGEARPHVEPRTPAWIDQAEWLKFRNSK